MQRRTFIHNSAMCAVAISTTGFIRFDNGTYVGDCETTTDILGPFYRPDSPVRNDLVMKDVPGKIIELSGTVRHKDCSTILKGAKVELWHCDGEGVYDNTSAEFRHRGTVLVDDAGFYKFRTILPSPYRNGQQMRPAHFHLLISAPGYQSLVTQLYFDGDKHIKTDRWASAEGAKRRILKVQEGKNGRAVVFDVNMPTTLAAEPASLDQLVGLYRDEKTNEQLEFFKKDNALWVKSELFGLNLVYEGNNTFKTSRSDNTFQFEILGNGDVRVTATRGGKKIVAGKVK